jgi:hypothetical protein
MGLAGKFSVHAVPIFCASPIARVPHAFVAVVLQHKPCKISIPNRPNWFNIPPTERLRHDAFRNVAKLAFEPNGERTKEHVHGGPGGEGCGE